MQTGTELDMLHSREEKTEFLVFLWHFQPHFERFFMSRYLERPIKSIKRSEEVTRDLENSFLQIRHHILQGVMYRNVKVDNN
jgi:hypothetical protein